LFLLERGGVSYSGISSKSNERALAQPLLPQTNTKYVNIALRSVGLIKFLITRDGTGKRYKYCGKRLQSWCVHSFKLIPAVPLQSFIMRTSIPTFALLASATFVIGHSIFQDMWVNGYCLTISYFSPLFPSLGDSFFLAKQSFS
jgi:hypothetical protein